MARRRNIQFPLYQAAWQFATRAMKAEAIRERAQPRSRLRVRKFDDSRTQELAETIRALGEQVMDVLDPLRDPYEPTVAMKLRLVCQLHEGKFEAFGIMTAPDLRREPHRIPPFIFSNRPKINWPKNTVENFQQRFEGVSVRRLTSTQAPTSVPVTQPARRGRSTKDSQIAKVIDALIDRGVELGNMERRLAYDRIRKFAKKELGADISRGYSDPVLQRHLLRRFGKRL